jgi:glycosyltransferase involved in cell wall biosynthesis
MLRVAFFGTHPQQFNGYSKVVYELAKVIGKNHKDDVEWHIFGFQKFHTVDNYRNDVPTNVHVYDAFEQEGKKAPGFGYGISRRYVETIKPDVVIIFNDLIILTTHLKELANASNRTQFRLIAYIDQVYLTQHPHYLKTVNATADEAILFTEDWTRCVQRQGLTIKCNDLPHGFDPNSYFPIPQKLARRFYGIKDEDFVLLNLNRNTIRKRWDICMMAFALVVHRRPECPIKLVIGTDTKCAQDLYEIFEHEMTILGVANTKQLAEERLIIPGKPQQLSDRETNILYNVADCGINTCEGEGFGLCNFEQAAIGIPQIVPWTGGFKDFFTDENACIVHPKAWIINPDPEKKSIGGKVEICDYHDFADAIIKMYDDKSLRLQYSINARKTIPITYKWDDIGRKLVDICKESATHIQNRHKPDVLDANIDMMLVRNNERFDSDRNINIQSINDILCGSIVA